MRDYLRGRYGEAGGPPHIWCGVSVEDRQVLVRVRHLQESPVPVRFLSMEPLLESIGDFDLSGIGWVIVGGESGPGWREMKEEWVCEIRDLCERDGVIFFFKQWAGFRPKLMGRDLGGREHNDMPLIPRVA